MEKITDLFKQYEPIVSIYENDLEYFCFPETAREPFIVFYDKKLKQYDVRFFCENEEDTEALINNSKLIYGEALDFSDSDLDN